MTRPQNNTLAQMVRYLESIGLSVYGPCIDLQTGYRYGACMDYDAERVLRYRKLHEAGKLTNRDGEDE
jgi:hypothetical protein